MPLYKKYISCDLKNNGVRVEWFQTPAISYVDTDVQVNQITVTFAVSASTTNKLV